jgi:hypothetical protein
MSKISQKQQIINKLLDDGFVSRNWALQNYIGRLASRMTDLKDEGWEFRTENVEEHGGINFYYYVLNSPHKKVQYYVPVLNKVITKYI